MSETTGAAIRKLRLSKGLTLAALSEASGVPISTLSRVELGQNSLNYEKLVRLCRVLNVDVEGLTAREPEAPPVISGRRSVVRAGDGVEGRIGGNAGRRAAAELLSRSLSPIVVDVTAASLDAHGPPARHPGEAYALVLDGTVELHCQLYAPLTLEAGDGLYFDAGSGYALLAPKGPARVLVVAAGETAFD